MLPMRERFNLRNWLSQSPAWVFICYVSFSSFMIYACMYGFRKPFTAAGYDNASLWGIGYKTVLVTAQLLGYTASKFIGIKVIAEMRPDRRILRHAPDQKSRITTMLAQ